MITKRRIDPIDFEQEHAASEARAKAYREADAPRPIVSCHECNRTFGIGYASFKRCAEHGERLSTGPIDPIPPDRISRTELRVFLVFIVVVLWACDLWKWGWF